LNGGLGGTQSQSERYEEEKTVLPLPGFELNPESSTFIFNTMSSGFLGTTKHPWITEE